MPQRGQKNHQPQKMKAVLGKKTAPKERPLVFVLPENLKARVVQTMALREEHTKQLHDLELVVADNVRAINNLVIGWLSGKDGIVLEKYHIRLDDDGGTVVLVPMDDPSKEPESVKEVPVPLEGSEQIGADIVEHDDTGREEVSVTGKQGEHNEGEG